MKPHHTPATAVTAATEVTATVNSVLTLLYWRIGRRIRSEVLQGARAGYGEQIVAAVARQLEAEHGRGFGTKNLRHMLRFGEVLESEDIVYALSRQVARFSTSMTTHSAYR